MFLKGAVGVMINNIFGAHFKVYYGVMYKSLRIRETAEGSQLWHSDGGPGTCMNVMFCLNATTEKNGAMEFVPWEVSVKLFSGERKDVKKLFEKSSGGEAKKRTLLCDYYERRIQDEFSANQIRLTGDSGLALAFRNNVVHRGGYPCRGHERYVCVFHIYPSVEDTPWSKYHSSGICKVAPYPEDPAF